MAEHAYALDEPIELNDFTRVCGHFRFDVPDDEPPESRPDYLCTHPENRDERHRCFSFSCPLAWRLTTGEPEDRRYFDAIGISEEDELGEDSDWMVPYRIPLAREDGDGR